MAINFHFGTGAQAAAAVTRNILPWLYTTAFRATSASAGSARMVDIKTDIDKTTAVRITKESIANVYQTLTSDAVPVTNQVANAKGFTARIELKTMATKTVGTIDYYLPMECDIRVRIPVDAAITDGDIDTLVNATYAALLNQAGNNIVVSEIMRDALTPAGV